MVFRLTGRLAKTYHLYPNEVVVEKTPEALTVKARTDDCPALFSRLMRYMEHCEVLSPMSARKEMAKRIRQCLAALTT